MSEGLKIAFNLLLIGGLLGYALPALIVTINLLKSRQTSTYYFLANLFFWVAVGIALLVIAANQLPRAVVFSLDEMKAAIDNAHNVDIGAKIIRAEQTALILDAIGRFRTALIRRKYTWLISQGGV
jgi:hypothetical protein